MELRGTNGNMYIHGNRWEVVPQKLTDMPYYARTPINREQERPYRPSKKPVIEPKLVKGTESTVLHARNFLECIRSRMPVQCGHPHRPPLDQHHAHRQHRE